MLDFTIGVGVRTYFNDLKERTIAPGASITEEGQCLVYAADGQGGIAVQPSLGSTTSGIAGAAEIFAGFAITDALKIVTNIAVENFNVPAVAPYTVQLQNQNVLFGGSTVGEMYVYDNTTTGQLTYNTGVGTTQYNCTSAGLMTFNAARANDNITVTYRYDLTLAQTIDEFHQRSVNNFAQDYFSTVSVGCLDGEVFTTMYDAAQVYAIGAPVYTSGPSSVNSACGAGQVSSASGSTNSATLVGYVSQLPSTTSQFLGVKYKVTT